MMVTTVIHQDLFLVNIKPKSMSGMEIDFKDCSITLEQAEVTEDIDNGNL